MLTLKTPQLAVLVLFILAAASGTKAQVDSSVEPSTMIRNRADDGLRGSVKSYTEETTIPAMAGIHPEIHSQSTTEYDPQGRLTATRMHQSDGSQWFTRHQYSPSGELLKVVSGAEGGPLSSTSYTYDEQGRIQKIATEGQNDRPVSFHYDDHGRKTTTVTSSPADYRPNVASGGGPFEALTLPPNLPGGGTSITAYDEQDRPTEVQVRDTQGQLVMHATRIYDSQGRVIEEKQVLDNLMVMSPPEAHEKLIQESGLSREQLAQDLQAELTKLMGGQTEAYTISYQYDATGRLTHTSRRIFNQQDEIDTTYNEHGDIESEITRSTQTARADGTPPTAGPQPYSEVRYSYQYDEHGNWTEKSASYRSSPGEGFQSSSVLKRSFTYY